MKIQIYIFKQIFVLIFLLLAFHSELILSFRKYSKHDIKKLREEVRQMFQHAYNGYLKYASGYDELRPLSCDGVNTWGSYSLTLIDALDTLAVMGNYTEFRRVVKILTEKSNFDADINVSVFETNIRIVGGLLSAHLMSEKAGIKLEEGWPCNGPLLRLAEDVAKRLLPAFDTKTGMPYGTVNLRYGVPSGETSVTCTAGVGTFIVEFGTLSRLTGNPIYEEVALNALYALWNHRSSIGLFGNHIDVQTGRWTAQDSGIGAGVDSFYEYLVKGAILLNRPELLELFHEGRKGIDKYLRRDDWHVWVSMSKGQVTLPVFQSLEAYWPGVLSLVGETSLAMRTLHNYHSVWKQYGFLPEFYNIPNGEASVNRENYPLRPELIESVMYLYRATKDPFLLEVGEDILRSIQYSAKTSCGYATIKNVRDHRKEDRMESFFLAETTKYLYLLFDENNFLHNEGEEGTILSSEITKNKECIIDAGGYIFNTEAHPIDPSALQCCYDKSIQKDFFNDFDYEQFIGENLKIKQISQDYQQSSVLLDSIEDITNANDKKFMEHSTKKNENKNNLEETAEKIAMEVIKNFEKFEIEFLNDDYVKKFKNDDLVEINLPNILDSNENSKQQRQQQFLNKRKYNNIKYENIQSEIAALENQTFVKNIHILRNLLKVVEEKVLEAIKRSLNIIKSYLNINETLNNTNETVLDTSDFWNVKDTSPLVINLSDFIEKIKYNEQFKIYEEVIQNLAQLQEEYIKKTSKELSTDFLLFKISKFLIEAYNNVENLTNFDEIDIKISEIINEAQKKYEYQIINKTVDLHLYKHLHDFHNTNDIKIVMKRLKQAQIIKSDISNGVNKSENITLKKELLKFLKIRIKLQMSYRKMIKLKASIKKAEDVLSKSTIDNIDYDNMNENILMSLKDELMSEKESLDEFENESKPISSDREDTTPKSSESLNDDIITVEKISSRTKNYKDKETGVGTVEQINFDESLSGSEQNSNLQKFLSSSSTTNQKNTSNGELFLQMESSGNNDNSIIGDFVKTILKTTMQSKDKFNETEFLLKVRANGLYLNKSQNFELFHCKAQPFLNRFSLRGQFFDDD